MLTSVLNSKQIRGIIIECYSRGARHIPKYSGNWSARALTVLPRLLQRTLKPTKNKLPKNPDQNQTSSRAYASRLRKPFPHESVNFQQGLFLVCLVCY